MYRLQRSYRLCGVHPKRASCTGKSVLYSLIKGLSAANAQEVQCTFSTRAMTDGP